MGASDNFQETQALLSRQKKKFLWIIAITAVIAIGLAASTTYLAVKVNGAYPSAKVELHVWSHQDSFQGTRNFKKFKVPDNATVYTLMEHAATEGGSQFKYDFKQYEFGKYITSVGGTRESPAENLYWILYKLTESPDPNNPPTLDASPEFGVDDLRIENGDVYLFWITKIDYPATQKRLGALGQPCTSGHVGLNV